MGELQEKGKYEKREEIGKFTYALNIGGNKMFLP